MFRGRHHLWKPWTADKVMTLELAMEVYRMLETLPSVNKAVHCDVPARTVHHLTRVAELDDLAVGPEQLLWLDLERPTAEELTRLTERFHFHPLAAEDAEHGHQRPKVEEYEGFVFLVFYAASLSLPRHTVQSIEVRMFVSDSYLITIHDTPLAAMDANLSLASNDLNRVMRTLTAWSIMLMSGR
jgi:Mg2+ and Co2+ transporter CorA